MFGRPFTLVAPFGYGRSTVDERLFVRPCGRLFRELGAPRETLASGSP